MELYGPPLPWLDKPAATATAIAAIGRATVAAGGELAYVEQRGGRPRWLSAGPPLTVLDHVETHGAADASAAEPSVARRLPPRPRPARVELPRRNLRLRRLRFHRRCVPRHLAQAARTPAGTSRLSWSRTRRGSSRSPMSAVSSCPSATRPPARWARSCSADARRARRRAANEERLESTLGVFARLGFDPVLLGSSERSGSPRASTGGQAVVADCGGGAREAFLLAIAAAAFVAAPLGRRRARRRSTPASTRPIRVSATRSRYVVTATVDACSSTAPASRLTSHRSRGRDRRSRSDRSRTASGTSR